MISDIFILIMEWIGTVAFAVSGTLVAVSCSLDLFGVLIVGCVTAVGGGMIRDILIHNLPPNIFHNPYILLVAAITSFVVFNIAYINRRRFKQFRERIETVNNFFDALGLAAFSVTGVEIACASEYSGNLLLVITLGVLTGVGGGVIRDILVNEKPYILTKHIYAVASILGSGIYYFISIYLGYRVWGAFIASAVTIAIRMLAAKYHWNLPKIKLEDN